MANETGLPDFSAHGLLDFRYQHARAEEGWFEGGLGKFRFGGDASRVRVNEAALVLQGRLWEWVGQATLKYAAGQRNPLDLTEAFLAYRPVSTTPWRLRTRLGFFFPPVSLENTGTAWTSPYTLNSSAVNGWVGEELRVLGGEAHVGYRLDSGDRLGMAAAGFAANDTAGVLLAWRGWSLDDYESTLRDRLALPQGVGIHAAFPLQSGVTRPYVEVDGRPGYYLGLTAERPGTYVFRTFYYDNRANPTAIENGQYGWHTRFWSLATRLDLPWKLTVISQGILGRTSMGAARGRRHAVDADFWAASLLLSKAFFDGQRFSLRHDRFGTGENDYIPEDRNREHGYALTANYNVTVARRHQVNLEVSYVVSDRPARALLNQNSRQEELLWQVAYRFFF